METIAANSTAPPTLPPTIALTYFVLFDCASVGSVSAEGCDVGVAFSVTVTRIVLPAEIDAKVSTCPDIEEVGPGRNDVGEGASDDIDARNKISGCIRRRSLHGELQAS